MDNFEFHFHAMRQSKLKYVKKMTVKGRIFSYHLTPRAFFLTPSAVASTILAINGELMITLAI